LAAGNATLDVLEKNNVLEKLNSTGDQMRKALSDLVSDSHLPYSVTGIASMFKVFFGTLPWDYTSALRCDKSGYFSFFRRMLDSGIFLTPSQFETDFISAAHSSADIEDTLEAFKSNLKG
jgi:glutamate-1-semialdehyde 2,1-aminomutase